MATILVTGAAGFIGRALVDQLLAQGFTVRALVRSEQPAQAGVEYFVADITESDDLEAACRGVDCVVHLAGRAHVLHETAEAPLEAFRRVNVEGTLRLAQVASKAGVGRFVFVSSIGVNGDSTTNTAFDESFPANPHADYALSKLEAEQGLQHLCQQLSMDWVIVRPPMVIDSQAPGNFARLLKLVDRALPLPFGLTRNRRSLVSLRNLVSLLSHIAIHPAAAREVFLIADGDDVSTAEMVLGLAQGMNRHARLVPVPPVLLQVACLVFKRQRLYNQLYGSLQIDAGKARRLLNWTPPESTAQALVRIGKEYRRRV
ncbi:SDR family NAD(P)-dependent oxidoreductase [Pseudomonas sp. X10]